MCRFMDGMWVNRLKELAARNRPSRKPQLWENLPLAVARRATFELRHRLERGWLDQPQVIDLSGVGFEAPARPVKMEIILRDLLNKALFLYGTFEISETRVVQAFLRSGMTFVDVGANIGYYSLVAARLVGPTGCVHSFEPNAEVRHRLEHNIRLNSYDNAVVHAEAMAGHTGEVTFYLSTVEENSGISSIVPGAGLGSAQVVPSVTLDDFVLGLPGRRVDLLKMDIEGAELSVIEGGQRVLASEEAPALLFESFDVSQLLPVLESLGYEIRRLHYTLSTGLELRDPCASQPGLFDAYESPNFFAVKRADIFDEIVRRANSRRAWAWRLFGRL
jgi:FkbM family methyltransferase